MRGKPSAQESGLFSMSWGERMTADMGAKALSSQRLSYLKKQMGMLVNEKKEQEDSKEGGKTVKKCQSDQVKVLALKMITLAAALSMAKGEEDVEKKESEGSDSTPWTLYVMMAVYTAVVILVTVMMQWRWKKEKELVKEKSKQKEEEDSKWEDEEEEEEGYGTPVIVVSEDENQGKSEGGRGMSSRDTLPPAAPSGTLGEAPFGLCIYRTKYGQVYHRDPKCPTLAKPTTGPAYKSEVCETCLKKKNWTKGTKIWWSELGEPVHLLEKCPKREAATLHRGCSVCSEG